MTRLCRAKEKILCSCECAKNIFNDTGDNGEGETPVLIPNTAVKPFCAESTELDTTWEGRTLPVTRKRDSESCLSFLVTTRQRPSRVATRYAFVPRSLCGAAQLAVLDGSFARFCVSENARVPLRYSGQPLHRKIIASRSPNTAWFC